MKGCRGSRKCSAARCFPGTMKRCRVPSSSEDSDANGSLSTTWSQSSRAPHRRGSCSRHEDRKPSEVFRTDLITAMKLHDSFQLSPDEYYVLADPWRQEWEKGVQVPVSPGTIPQPVARLVSEEKPPTAPATAPALGDGACRYDLNDMDAAWLELTNEEFREMGMAELDEGTMERVLEALEQRCHDNMSRAIESEEGLGIEYDEDVVCDVCQSPEGEDGNEMVFCDKCDICVHQACYGILKVPEGSWLCRTCALGVQPRCLLCPKKGGAMKPTRSGTKWVHVSCALWIPEVSIGSPEKMEPITKVSHIPSSRWALLCSLCEDKVGAAIQCSVRNCRTAFHVTCAFDRGLEMKTILADNDEVKFKSYCPKHSSPRPPREGALGEGAREGGAPAGTPWSPAQPPADPGSARKQKLQQLEDEFYTFVDLLDVARALRLPEDVVDFVYQYWKLKRKVNLNQPLLAPRKDEDGDRGQQEQEALLRRLQLFTHLRQDLERVRTLTHMVTRREKMKRSLCRLQEHIFSLYTELQEQERGAGAPGAPPCPALDSTLLFDSPAGPGTPRLEDLKWHSAFFRKRMGTSLAHSLKKPKRGGPAAGARALLKPPDLCGRRAAPLVPESLLSLEKTFAEARLLLAPPKNGAKNGAAPPGPGARREHRLGLHCDLSRGDARARPCRPSHKPLARTAGCPGPRREAAPPGHGSLARAGAPQTTAKVPTAPAGPGKNWGGFRIPKKGERPARGDACAPHVGCPYLGLGRLPPKDRARPLPADAENDGYTPDVEMSDSESEASEEKFVHAGALGRRTDAIRRSILAS
ncbi:protein Jade-1 isoform X2 [Sorex araneus]|uniref:protein Jade-1 isoform X2 n=1 Tax=Sorex araneus TaxID=42254 RepID=UPI0024340856|nr:protein Jade-1 isoform X2 [Sorex araneus]